MLPFFKKKKALSVGLGVGLAGAAVLALRYGLQRPKRTEIPDSISPAIFASRVASTSHGDIVYHTSGAGQPLVFLHGIYPGASSYEWSRVYARFALNYEVIAPDLIGFGESERPRQVPDASEQARSLVEFLHTVCRGQSPIVVASGVGAQFAFLVASQHPELFARIIAWLPMGVSRPIRRRLARRMLGIGRVPLLRSFLWRNYLSKPQFMNSWLQQIGFAAGDMVDPGTVRVLSTCASLPGAERAIWAFLQGKLSANLTDRLGSIAAPTTIFWPEKSEFFPLGEAEEILRKLPRARLTWVENHGLLAPLAAPDYFATLIQEELDRGLEISLSA